MHVHPALATLRADPVSQRRNRQIMEEAHLEWLKSDQMRAFASELAQYSAGTGLEGLPDLASVLNTKARAVQLANSFIERFTEACKAAPLAEFPLRHTSSEGFARLQLLQQGRASLSLCAYEQLEKPYQPESVHFADRETHEIVISGSARIVRHELTKHADEPAQLASQDLEWSAGSTGCYPPGSAARHFARVGPSLLLLQLSRSPEAPGPTREYRLCDGQLVQESSGDKRASEQQMALAVLGALGQCRSCKPMAEFALCSANEDNARWEAVRQLLAIDTRSGFALLQTLAKRADDPLSGAARDLTAKLLELHPQLNVLQEEYA